MAKIPHSRKYQSANQPRPRGNQVQSKASNVQNVTAAATGKQTGNKSWRVLAVIFAIIVMFLFL